MVITLDLHTLTPYGSLIFIDLLVCAVAALILWSISSESRTWTIRIGVIIACLIWILNLISIGVIVIKT